MISLRRDLFGLYIKLFIEQNTLSTECVEYVFNLLTFFSCRMGIAVVWQM